ncbi:rho GDP dissociation inhibitor [Parahypoxylon ruwenzoriense]
MDEQQTSKPEPLQRGGNVRHMASTPLLGRSPQNPLPPNHNRYSEEDTNVPVLLPGPPSPSPESDAAQRKQSLKDFLKTQLQIGTPTKVSNGPERQHQKLPQLRTDFANWLKGGIMNRSNRSPSTSSSGSGLNPAMTCRGLPGTIMMEPEVTATGNPANPPPSVSASATTPKQQEAIKRFAFFKDVSNKNISTDAGDESLQRYKQSLGLGGGKDLSDPSDPRVCIIQSLTMESPGRPPVTIDLSSPGSETTLKDRPFKIKEGCKFTMVATFKVQHEILSGLQYVQVVKRKGIKVSKDSEMLGSYAPSTDKQPLYSKRFQEEEAPSGMLARGHYNATSSFVDDDKKTHLQFEWSFDIGKDW